MTAAEMVGAARVPDSVPEGYFGPWEIRRHEIDDAGWPGAIVRMNAGCDRFTALHRMTMGTMMRDHGEVVMEDSPLELRRHLPIWLVARGRVLVTGLGLGCVVRGLLVNPEVTHVDVIEIDQFILRRIGVEFSDNPRVEIRHGDATTMRWRDGERWDFAWHDLWHEDGTAELCRMHLELMHNLRDRVPLQGAWGMDRAIKRIYRSCSLGARRRNHSKPTEATCLTER